MLSRQSNIVQKVVTVLGVALRKLSGGTNLPERETLKINRGLSRCDDENCRVVEKWREITTISANYGYV